MASSGRSAVVVLALLAETCSPSPRELLTEPARVSGSGAAGASQSAGSVAPFALREPDPAPPPAAPLPTVCGTVDRRVPEGMRLPELDPRARIEFWAGGDVHVHQPFLVDDRFLAAIPAAFGELPHSHVFWRAFVTSGGKRLLPLDLRWRRLSEVGDAELRWSAPPVTFVRVVAPEAGVPLDALLEPWDFIRQDEAVVGSSGADRCGHPRDEWCADGGAWWTVPGGLEIQASIAEWWRGEIELLVRAPKRVARMVELDARGGGEREVRLWPAREVEIVAIGEPVAPQRGGPGDVWLRSGRPTHHWRSAPIELVHGRVIVKEAPLGPLELVREPDPREGVQPIVIAVGCADGSERSRIEVDGSELARAGRRFGRCGGSWSLEDEPAIARIRFELHDGATRVPLRWVCVTPRPRLHGGSRDGSACELDQLFEYEGVYRVEFESIDGFEPFAPIEVTVTAGERRALAIPLTRER